jgi:WXG100 family type VII secretion target
MSVAPTILIRFQNISQAATNAKNTTAQMNEALGQLKSDLANLKQIWEGAAASDYKDLQGRWDRALADLNQILQEISTTLDKSCQDYQTTENQCRQAWS